MCGVGGCGGHFLAKELNIQLELNHDAPLELNRDNKYFWKSKTSSTNCRQVCISRRTLKNCVTK